MINAHVNDVAAYLYRHLGEQMPPPKYSLSGTIDIEADNALIERWSQGSDVSVISLDDVEAFIRETAQLLVELSYLGEEASSTEYMTCFYDAAKATFGEERSSIRTYFRWLYLVAFGYENGPRWGEFVDIYGVQNFQVFLIRRFREL
jgi:lysyl-tRNA synthetase class I